GRWADGVAAIAAVNTILPPNSPSCSAGKQLTAPGIYSAGSFHAGGAHLLMADGAVKFITESIDHGDSNAAVVRLPQSNEAEGDNPTETDHEDDNDSSSQSKYVHTESPHGIWGALGTARSNDAISSEL
ncbi:MAG: DUF1559 domain-containing protein, partial [Rhodopirellula sp. JB055]|uniref:DUF1559 family PulG-like putative transporter n=1 Tax=Rhodopirellula sp. JB055 TaxID=3342846 RepID=UPI00370B74F5